MKIRKKIFHYRLSGFLLMTGFVISFICFFNTMNLRRLMINEEKETEKYRYKSEMYLDYYNPYQEYVTPDVLYSETGNVMLQDIWLYRDQEDGTGTGDILCNQNEPLNYPVIEGTLPESDEEVNVPTVILGIKLKDVTQEHNGMYFYTIEGQRYRVCAFIGSDKSDVFDYKLILYGKTMSRKIWDKINKQQGASGMIGSNNTLVMPLVDSMNEAASHSWEGVQIIGHDYQSYTEDMDLTRDSMYYYIILLFCCFNMIFVSEYWIKERYKEIAVRKMFGYNNRKIIFLLYRELVNHAVIAVIIACGIQALLTLFLEEYLLLYFSQLGYYLLISNAFVLLSCAILMIYPINIMKKEDVMQKTLKECS